MFWSILTRKSQDNITKTTPRSLTNAKSRNDDETFIAREILKAFLNFSSCEDMTGVRAGPIKKLRFSTFNRNKSNYYWDHEHNAQVQCKAGTQHYFTMLDAEARKCSAQEDNNEPEDTFLDIEPTIGELPELKVTLNEFNQNLLDFVSPDCCQSISLLNGQETPDIISTDLPTTQFLNSSSQENTNVFLGTKSTNRSLTERNMTLTSNVEATALSNDTSSKDWPSQSPDNKKLCSKVRKHLSITTKPPSAATSAVSHMLPPCRICGDAASGVHFGVNSCEACNEFFRRTLKCNKTYRCARRACNITGSKRNNCAYCRYQRCLQVGMSRNRIKTGRYSIVKKTLDVLEIQQIQAANRLSGESLQLENVIQRLVAVFEEFRFLEVDFEDGELTRKQLRFYRKYMTRKFQRNTNRCFYEEDDQVGNSQDFGHVMNTPTEHRHADKNFFLSIAHGDGEVAQGDKRKLIEVNPRINCARDESPANILCRRAIVNSCASHDLLRATMQLWEQWIIDFVRLVKLLPGFTNLTLSDQTSLLTTSVCQWYILNDYKGYDTSLQVTTKMSGCTYHFEEWAELFGEGYVSTAFLIAGKLKKLKLSRTVVMLMKAIVITSPDLDDLEDKPSVERLHWRYVQCLLHELSKPCSAQCRTPTGREGSSARVLAAIVDILVLMRNMVHEYSRDAFVSPSAREKILYSRRVVRRELRESSSHRLSPAQFVNCRCNT